MPVSGKGAKARGKKAEPEESALGDGLPAGPPAAGGGPRDGIRASLRRFMDGSGETHIAKKKHRMKVLFLLAAVLT